MKIKLKLKKFLGNINSIFVKTTCVLILFSVIFSSIDNAYESHISFYKKEPNEYVEKIFSWIRSIPTYSLFLNYTGLNTGYGFFSPNVSSDFVILHEMYKNNSKIISTSNSYFKTKEGALRFANLNSLYMDKLESMESDSVQIDSLKSKYLNVIINRMNNYHVENQNLDSINSIIYLYHFPFLKEYPNVEPLLLKVESYKKNKKN